MTILDVLIEEKTLKHELQWFIVVLQWTIGAFLAPSGYGLLVLIFFQKYFTLPVYFLPQLVSFYSTTVSKNYFLDVRNSTGTPYTPTKPASIKSRQWSTGIRGGVAVKVAFKNYGCTNIKLTESR